jgi:phage-related protein
MGWTVEALDKRVEKEIQSLPADLRADLADTIKRIIAVGILDVGDHVKSLGSGLYEMRLSARSGIARAIYVQAKGERLVIVVAFVKKTQKTPKQMLDLAKKRAKEVT